jgi:Ca2+-binding RTX toxin-like protein
MKRFVVIVLAVLTAALASSAQAEERSLTVLLAGDSGNNSFSVVLSKDGRSYLILANQPLEVGGDVCTHPEEHAKALDCEAAAIGGFEVNGAGGNDRISFFHDVPVPVTLRGGPGNDRLAGGAGSDKLLGGSGNDKLVGNGGGDWLFGGPGEDRLYGGPGDDRLAGGPGQDVLVGGPGHDTEAQ